MTEVSRYQDPDTCLHEWWLMLYTSGRQVALECSVCKTTDMQVWGPGGVADLVTYAADIYGGPPDDEVYIDRIKVNNGQHNSEIPRTFAVDLSVTQSTSISGYRGGGSVGMTTETKVNVTPRWYRS